MGKDNRNIPCGATYPAVSNKDSVFRHFTIGELTKSETAERFGIDNTPTAAQIDSLGSDYGVEPKPIPSDYDDGLPF